MSISAISAVRALPLPNITASTAATAHTAATAPVAAGPAGAAGVAKPDFGRMVSDGLEKLQSLQTSSDQLAVKGATGDLTDIHDYMIAANEASVATELTVAVRNKAVEAFTEIMRMQV